MKRLKQFILSILFLFLTIGFLPTISHAEETDIKVGDTYFFGNYEGNAVEWQVLSIEDQGVLLISKYCFEPRSFNLTRSTWEKSSLRNYLNNKFLEETFSSEEQSKIQTVHLINDMYVDDKNGLENVPGWVISDNQPKDTYDKVFILSIPELIKYYDVEYHKKPDKLGTEDSYYTCDDLICPALRTKATDKEKNSTAYWTRTSFSDGIVHIVSHNQFSYCNIYKRSADNYHKASCSATSNVYVRPAMYVKKDALKKDTFTGTRTISNSLYLYKDGNIVKNAWVKGTDNNWYHSDFQGIVQTKWQTIGNKKYYFEYPSGIMKSNCWIEEKEYSKSLNATLVYKYYLCSGGDAAVGFKTIDKISYYFDANGHAHNAWLKYNNKWYYCSTGKILKGWQQIYDNGKKFWYYFDKDGAMKTGWLQLNGKWYYLKSSGQMATGWVQIGKKWYYMDKNGIMKTGWVKDNNKWYYFNSDGSMVTGSKKIGNKVYKFSSSGVCQNP